MVLARMLALGTKKWIKKLIQFVKVNPVIPDL